MRRHQALAGLVLLFAALVWSVVIAPLAGRLPASYSSEQYMDATARARETPTDEWSPVRLTGRRLDTTLTSTDARSIVQSDLYWALLDGTLYFENAGVYAVDRRTRANVPGLGNVGRRGQFLLPPDVERRPYVIWDAQFIGPRTARFIGEGAISGVPVYRFDFDLRNLDETPGYSHLPDVPERYSAHTHARGTLIVEPETGVVVDYSEHGHSFFARPDGSEVAGLFEWEARYTPQTRGQLLQQARRGRTRLRMARYYVPIALAAAGALLLLGALRLQRRRA